MQPMGVKVRSNTQEAARGRWREILPVLGVSVEFLNGKHQACPLCGGKDRARFDDRKGNGDYFCSRCGAGNGFVLLEKLHGWDFKRAANEVDRVVGSLSTTHTIRDYDRRPVSPARVAQLWSKCRAIGLSDPVARYLGSRGLYAWHGLRHDPWASTMVALFSDPDGGPGSLHYTNVTPEGIKLCRRFLPRGKLPEGGAVRLGPEAPTMGIAEGIETALSASVLFGMPVWAATSDGMLAKWKPPAITKRVVIFGDNDLSFAGQAAAYALAKRLVDGVKVTVEIPDRTGDWNDVLVEQPHARTA